MQCDIYTPSAKNRHTYNVKRHHLSWSCNIYRFSSPRVPDNMLRTDNLWSSTVLRFMRYCYYRHSAFPFPGRVAANYIIQVTRSATRCPQLKRFLSSPSSPSAIHKTWETECNVVLYVEGREVAVLGGGHLLESAGIRCSLRTYPPFEPVSHEHYARSPRL